MAAKPVYSVRCELCPDAFTLPHKRAQILAVISTHFYIPDKRMGTIQELLKFFQIGSISSLPLLSLGRNLAAPWVAHAYLHPPVGLSGNTCTGKWSAALREGHECCHKHLMGSHRCPWSLCEPSMPQTHPCISMERAKLAEIRLLKACPGMFSQHVANATAGDSFLWFELVVRIAGNTQLS